MLFEKRANALLDLCDATVTAGLSPSLVYLSLEAVHRRGWGSLYAALAEGEINVEQVRSLLSRHPLESGQPIYAVNLNIRPRCDAEASPERSFHHHFCRQVGGELVVAGRTYKLIAGLSFDRDSWTTPVEVQGVHHKEEAVERASNLPDGPLRAYPATVTVHAECLPNQSEVARGRVLSG